MEYSIISGKEPMPWSGEFVDSESGAAESGARPAKPEPYKNQPLAHRAGCLDFGHFPCRVSERVRAAFQIGF